MTQKEHRRRLLTGVIWIMSNEITTINTHLHTSANEGLNKILVKQGGLCVLDETRPFKINEINCDIKQEAMVKSLLA